MEFKALSKNDCEQIRLWRNETLHALRTPYLLTQEQQENFYYDTICDRNANSRYWGIWGKVEKTTVNIQAGYRVETEMVDGLIGMAGIENIEWENRRGEISLIIGSEYRGKTLGDEAFNILLNKGFNELNLVNIWGVCYECNPALHFWERQINRHKAISTHLPGMKFYQGKYFSGVYFNFERSRHKI